MFFFFKRQIVLEEPFMNSLEINANAFFRCCSFYWGRRMKSKIDKQNKTEGLLWGRGSEWLGNDPRDGDDKFVKFACHCPSSVRPHGVLWRNMRREKARAVVRVWVSWDTMSEKQSSWIFLLVIPCVCMHFYLFKARSHPSANYKFIKHLASTIAVFVPRFSQNLRPTWGG